MDIEFNYGISDKVGSFSAYVEWVEGVTLNRKDAYETACAVVETLVCWKGWPHLNDEQPLPVGAWTYTMDTFETHGNGPDVHVFNVVFQSVLDQLQFVSWWDTHTLENEGSEYRREQVEVAVSFDAIAFELDEYIAGVQLQ